MKPLTREDLDGARCQTPGCQCPNTGPIYMDQKCHPGAGTATSYENGALRVECRACHAFILEVQVASQGFWRTADEFWLAVDAKLTELVQSAWERAKLQAKGHDSYAHGHAEGFCDGLKAARGELRYMDRGEVPEVIDVAAEPPDEPPEADHGQDELWTFDKHLDAQRRIWEVSVTVEPMLGFGNGALVVHGRVLAQRRLLTPEMYEELYNEAWKLRKRGCFLGMLTREEYEAKLDELHKFEVTKTALEGFNTGRPRYRVECKTCGVLVHPGSTGPDNLRHAHINEPDEYVWVDQDEAFPSAEPKENQ